MTSPAVDNEGYLILAVGRDDYIDMARNLAASIRVMDGGRRICLVHDEAFLPGERDRRLFDDFSLLRSDPRYPGVMNKIRLFPTSPYRRTMFVDADCLLLKTDIGRYWELARQYPFAITGKRRMHGEWKGVDIATLLTQEGAPYLVQMNSGVFCFDKGPEAAGFFAGLNDFYLRRKDGIALALHHGRRTQADEIYIGLWMGLNGLDSCGGKFGENSWMASTWGAFGMTLKPECGVTILRKPKQSLFGRPNPIGGWDRLSPSFVHFIGLKPSGEYKRLAAYFQAKIA
jgi:hypothetical protein